MFSKLKCFFLFLFPPTRIKMEREKEEFESKSRAQLDCWACHKPARFVPKKEYQYPAIVRIFFGYIGGFAGIGLLIVALGMAITVMGDSISRFGAVGIIEALTNSIEMSFAFAVFISGALLTFLNYFFTKKICFYSCEKCGFQIYVKAFAKSIA